MIRVLLRIDENQIVPSIILLTEQNLAVVMTYQVFVITMTPKIALISQRMSSFPINYLLSEVSRITNSHFFNRIRSYNGICNNLKKKQLGAALTPYFSMINPQYGNDFLINILHHTLICSCINTQYRFENNRFWFNECSRNVRHVKCYQAHQIPGY